MSTTKKQEGKAKEKVGEETVVAIEPKFSNDKLNSLIKKYFEYEKIKEHRQYIEKLIRENNVERLESLIGKRLTFGTAGIRGSMGAGFGQMNELVIIQTSQGLASYLIELEPKASKESGVVIGHDARHNSARFARLAALAFLQKGIPVYFCDHIIPTPLIALGVKHFDCIAGIVITASHNPKNDNGYKVFWTNGAQILPPHDKHIQEHITFDVNQKPWPKAWQHEMLRSGSTVPLPENWLNLLSRVHGELSKNYFSYIENLVGDYRSRNQTSNICITYTTMHGVGHSFLSRALDIAGFEDTFPVELQRKPDPDFSTVKFPNPEEAGALDLAFETAKHANSNLILALDPDADRCAAALYDSNTDYKRQLTGNEIGALLGWWIWHCYCNKEDLDPSSPDDQKLSRKKREVSDCYMISTAVSSKFLQSMAKVEGFQFVETLTGFKYMGNTADELIKKHNKHVLFAYEEAIGYMVDSSILDKDGISAAIQLAQCAAYLATFNRRNLVQHLDWLYIEYGYHFSLNSYYLCTDSAIIGEIFHNLQSNYPIDFGPNYRVTRVRDLNNGYDSGYVDGKATLPCSSSSFMVTFFVEHDIIFTIRTSGTEPKIKYYSEIVAKVPRSTDTNLIESNDFNDKPQREAKESARNRLHRLVQVAVERCLKPSQYELEPAD